MKITTLRGASAQARRNDEEVVSVEPEARRWALTSRCGSYRYVLGRRWSAGPTQLWVLANPSTADAGADDPTVRRCLGFASAHGCGSLLLVNLWGWRATDPDELARVADPVGPGNDAAVREAVAGSTGPVVLGWGSRADQTRVDTVLALLAGRPTSCLGVTRDGHPRHPLYVAGRTRLQPWGGPGRRPAEAARSSSGPLP